LIEFIRKNGGEVYEMLPDPPAQLAKIVAERAARNGSSINRQNAEEIARLCLNNRMLAENETDKLCAYANGGEITREMVSAMVARQVETTVFALSKAVLALNTKLALDTLDELMRQNSEPNAVFPIIAASFVDLCRVKAALDSGYTTLDVINDFGYRGRDFVVNNAATICRRIPSEKLMLCADILRKTDLSLKSGSDAAIGRILIEEAIVKMIKTVRS